MITLASFAAEQERARQARQEAASLRDLHRIATCGLPMRYTGVHYGTRQVDPHIAARVADAYLEWAAEYDRIAAEIEANLATWLAGAESGGDAS